MATAKEISEFHDWALRWESIRTFLGKRRTDKMRTGNWLDLYLFLGGEAIPHELALDFSTIRAMDPLPWWERRLLEDLLAHGKDSPTHRSIQRFWERQSRGLTEEERASAGVGVKITGALLNLFHGKADQPEVVRDFHGSAALLLREWEESVPGMANRLGVTSPLRGTPGNNVIFDYSDRGRSTRGVGEAIHSRNIRMTAPDSGVQDILKKAVYDPVSRHYRVDDRGIGIASLSYMDKNTPWSKAIATLSDPYVMAENLEFMKKSRVYAFMGMVEEYNLDWAMAAFDWGGGETPRMPSSMRRFIAECPWGDPE